MIKRITNPTEFKKLLDNIFDLFEYENENEAHHFLRHNKEHISNSFANDRLLAWDFFVWGNLNKHNKFDAVIAFLNQKNEKFGEEIFSEYIWLSKNPNVGYRLLAKALKFAKEKEFKYINMNCVMRHPKAQKIRHFYEKMGFVKDSETYIAKL
jgi:predicted GNAT family N-acyltransferase